MEQNKHNIYATGGMKAANFLIWGNIMFWRVWGQRKEQKNSWWMKHFTHIEKFSTFFSQPEASPCLWDYWCSDVLFLSRKVCRAIILVKGTMRRRLPKEKVTYGCLIPKSNSLHHHYNTTFQISKRKKSINAVLLAVEIL